MIYTQHTEVIVASIIVASIARVMQLLDIQYNNAGNITISQLEQMFQTDIVLKALEKANHQGDLTLYEQLLDSEVDVLQIDKYIFIS